MITNDAIFALFTHLNYSKDDYDEFMVWHEHHGQSVVRIDTNQVWETLYHISDVVRFLRIKEGKSIMAIA